MRIVLFTAKVGSLVFWYILDIMLKRGMNLDHFWLKNKLFKNGLLYVTYWAVSIVGHDLYIYIYIYIYIWTIPAKSQPVQKNSFLQLFQSEINLDEKCKMIINRQEILHKKGLMWFFPKINGFISKSFLMKILTKNVFKIS